MQSEKYEEAVHMATTATVVPAAGFYIRTAGTTYALEMALDFSQILPDSS